MEQIVILILFVIGSIVSSIIQNKKKRAEEARQNEGSDSLHPTTPPAPRRPFERWPETAGQWQDELRKLLEPPKPPPVISPTPGSIPPAVIVPPATRPAGFVLPVSFARVKEQARPVIKPPSSRSAIATPSVLRWTRQPRAAREAFVASLVFAPPVALSPPSRSLP